MTKKITTMLGDIAPEQLGNCTMHEHTLIDLSVLAGQYQHMSNAAQGQSIPIIPENFSTFRNMAAVPGSIPLQTVDTYANEIKCYANVGGNTIVDCSAIGMRHTANMLELAKRAMNEQGVHIVASTGLYTAQSRREEHKTISEDAQYALFADEIANGMEGTGSKPGMIKCAISALNETNTAVCDAELATVRACAKLAAETGYLLGMHTAPTVPMPLIAQVTDMILELGVEPDRLVIYHMDFKAVPTAMYVKNRQIPRDMDVEPRLELLKKGVNISLDGWGSPMQISSMLLMDDFDRMRLLTALLDAGYEDHLVLGHDVSAFLFTRCVGNYGYTRTLGFVGPVLQQCGYSEDVVKKLFVTNPMRLLQHD